MTDARLKQNYSLLEGVTMDLLLLDSGMLDEREELATGVRVALGTDALAAIDEILPDPDSTDRRGWWGDMEAADIWEGWDIGCKNWLLTRTKIVGQNAQEGSTLARAKNYTQDALKWLIDKGIATRVDVVAKQTELQRIEVNVKIYRGNLLEIDLRYQMLWQEDKPLETPVRGTPLNSLRRVPFRNLVISSVKPTLTKTFNVFLTLNGQLVLSRTAPLASFGWRRIPLQGNVAISSVAPVVISAAQYKIPPQGNLVLSPTAPTAVRTVTNAGMFPARRDLLMDKRFPSVVTTHDPVYPTWDENTVYMAGAIVTWHGVLYQSQINFNQGQDPEAPEQFIWLRIS